MAAGEVQQVRVTADDTSATLHLTGLGLHVLAPTAAAADPGVLVLTVPKTMMHPDGTSILIPVEA